MTPPATLLALAAIGPWHWVGFIVGILLLLAIDLGLLHKEARAVQFREAIGWTVCWVALALAFGFFYVNRVMGREANLLFISGYITELSLSMDNVFVIALIFRYFKVPSPYQHRVLFWGIMGALVMRGVMIWAGTELVAHFEWTLYVFGVFLLLTGVRMMASADEGIEPERNPMVRVVRRFFPVTTDFVGARMTVRREGRLFLTPLALVLVMVEGMDLLFAVDSIPAIFGFTTNPFIVFTSNVFAILGLRSLYFLLAGAMDSFHYLKFGLALVLVFIGVKMLLDPHGSGPAKAWQIDLPISVSLGAVGGLIGLSIAASLIRTAVLRRGSHPADHGSGS